VAALLAVGPATAMEFAPALAGYFAEGHGVDATFLKVDDAWHQSSVPWNEATSQYGSGVPIGTLAWGSGVWGLADWRTAHGGPPPGMVQSIWSERVAEIAFGDDAYNTLYGSTWGAVEVAPLFARGGSQDNWTSRFAGYLRIAEAGAYNFGVLHDDGFFFRLGGAGGQTLSLANDYLNPRDVLGFASDLQLSPGLYAFELGAYDRLEAGVVELSWMRDGGPWQRVPTANLVAVPQPVPQAVPEPGTAALWLGGGLLVAAAARRRRPSAR
jgi:hypothetical protein